MTKKVRNPQSAIRNSQSVVIAGGGLAGISCAYHLDGPSVVIEREKELGGTARSYSLKGFTFDFTGHLLHLHNDYTKDLIRRLLRGNIFECRRNTWIFSKETYTRYPFQANLYGLPPRVIEECYLGLWDARRRFGPNPLEAPHPLNFRQWCERLFGKGISKHFMVPYNQKLWRVDLDEMTPDWCGQFVPQPKLGEVLAGALTDQTKAYGYNATFLYPKRGGIQALAKSFGKELPNVRLGTSIQKVHWRERTVETDTGDRVPYRHFVSTLPLVELVKRLEPFPEELKLPLDQLRWTSVLCVNVGVKRANISDRSWIYFPEDKFVFYRAGFPMNFTPHVVPGGCSSMYVEVSYQGAGYDTAAKRTSLFRRIREGLIAARVLKKSDTFPVVSFLPIRYGYVIYDFNRTAALTKILAWLRDEADASSIGRYGAWKYSFMEEAILDGKKAAEGLGGLSRGRY